MPNHVTTVIKGSPEAIKAIRDRFLSKDSHGEFLDFAKVIPVPSDVYQGDLPLSPQDVKEPRTAAHEAAVGIIAELHPKVADMSATCDEIQTALGAILEIAASHGFDLEALGYPVRTWYEWNLANWGTKWNSIECRFGEDFIRVETAWHSPEPVIREISRQLGEDVILKVEYADEDVGRNCGSYELRGGEVVARTDFEEGSEEAARFACEVKGWDPEEHLVWKGIGV